MPDLTHRLAEMQQQLDAANARVAALETQLTQKTDSISPSAPTLEAMQHFLRATLDAVAANVAVLDTDGTISHVNAAWKKFAQTNDAPWGVDYVGANYLDVCARARGRDSEEALAAAAGIRSMISGESDDFYLEYPCHSPTEKRWFGLRVTPFDEPAPRRVVVTHTTITERVIAEQEVQASHDELANILNSVEDVIWSSTLSDNSPTHISPSFEKVFGYPVQKFLEDPNFYKKMIHPDDVAQVEHAFQRIYLDNYVELDHRIILPDGKVRWIHRRTWIRRDADGKPLRIDGISSDITDRKQAEEDIRSLAKFPEENPNLVLRLRSDGQILYVNTSAKRLLEEWGRAIHEQAPDYWCELAAEVLSTQRTRTVEIQHQQQDWSIVVVAVPSEGYVNLYGTNITERKQHVLLQTRLTKVLESIANHQALPRVLEQLIHAIEAYNPTVRASVLLLDASSNQLRHGAAPSLPDSYNTAIDGLRIGAGAAVCGTAAYEKRLVIVENTLTDPLTKDFRDLAVQHRLLAVWSQPIFDHAGDVLGTFALYYDHPHSPNLAELELIQLAAHVAEIAITRTQEQQALLASEARYRGMFEMHHLPKMIVDPDSGAILDANPAAVAFYGYPLDTLKTMSMMDINLGTPEDISDKMQKALRGEVGSCFFRQRLANGSIHDMEIFPGPMRIDDKDVLNCIYTDVTAQEQAEAALQEANALLEQRVVERTAELERVKNRIEAIFNHSGDAILLLDIQRGVQQANHRFETLFGFAPDSNSYHGLRPTALFDPEDASRFESIIADVAETHETRQFEARAKRLDGSFFAAEISIAPVNRSDHAVSNLVCIIRDITERKEAQRHIAEEHNLLRTLINAVPDFIYVKDLEHRFVLTNAANARARGYQTPEEMVGKSDFDLFTPELAQQFHDEEEPILRAGQPLIDYEQPSLSATGGFAWASSTKVPLRNLEGEIIGLVGITHDITELKQTQRQIAEERNLLRRLIDTIPNFIYAKDTAHRFILANEVLARALNSSTPEELIGKSDFDFFPADLAAKFSAEEDELFRTGISILNKEELASRDSAWWVSTTKTPLYDLNGTLIGLVGASHDITEQKKNEAALREALKAEKEVGELKSRFVSIASHEFRTPLATIMATTNSLSAYRGKMTPEQIDTRLEKIRQQVMHMKGIMEDVLQLARIQAGKIEFAPVKADLDKLCQDIVEEFESERDRIVYKPAEQPLLTYFDLRLMRQVISNLIANALKYSTPETMAHIQLVRQDAQIIFTVEDHGIGIPPEDLKHLFEPFHRAKNVGAISGTGLGMSITKQAVEIHGGTITVDSELDVGTTITVTLPLRLPVQPPLPLAD